MARQCSAFHICLCERSLTTKLLAFVLSSPLWFEDTYAQLFLFQLSPGKLKKIEVRVSDGHGNMLKAPQVMLKDVSLAVTVEALHLQSF